MLAETAIFLALDADPDFRPAATRHAAARATAVESFDPGDMGALAARLRRDPPKRMILVVRPQTIDVEWAHRLLEVATGVDEDPFLDVPYGLVTGRDPAAAVRFAERVVASSRGSAARTAGLFGSWEGPVAPTGQPLPALASLGFDATHAYVLTSAAKESRDTQAREALERMAGRGLCLFFSHGYPDRMEACFTAEELRRSGVRLDGTVLVNCACFNGCPGRWWAPGPQGMQAMPPPAPEASVALELLDRGVAAYVAGVDAWHGPLAMQMAMHLADDGATLGDAQACMVNRLAMEMAPQRVSFAPVEQRKFAGEGPENRRFNAAAMVVYGDPGWAPFAEGAPRNARAALVDPATGRMELTLAPPVRGMPGADAMLTQSQLLDYFSIRSPDVMREAAFELHRAVPWPEPLPPAPALRVVKAECGDQPLPTGPVQAMVESRPDGRWLQVRVPLAVRAYGSTWLLGLGAKGATIVLTPEPAAPPGAAAPAAAPAPEQRPAP